eukprot:gene27373-29241_t
MINSLDPSLGDFCIHSRAQTLSPCKGRSRCPVTSLTVTFNFAKTAMGVGILSLAGTHPARYMCVGVAGTFALSGLAVGLALTALCGAITIYAADVVLQLFMATLAYFVVSKHFLATAAQHASSSLASLPTNAFLVPCAVVVFPLTLLKR